MPVPFHNEKPLSSIPRLLQTLRPGRLLAQRRPGTTVTRVKTTSSATPADVQEKETISDPNLSNRPESPPTSADSTTAFSNDITGDETQIRRLSIALGDAFEIQTKSPTEDEVRRSSAEEEALKNARPCWREQASRSAGPGRPLFDTARQALQDFCAEPIGPEPSDNHADVTREDSLPREEVDGTHQLADGESLDSNDHHSVTAANSSDDMANETTEKAADNHKEHVTFAESPVIDHSVRRQPLSRPPTPPLNPQIVGSVHQQPGHWDSIGAKAALQHWIADFTVFRDKLQEGLRMYFSDWTDFFLFPGARKLLRATLQIPKVLKVLFNNLDVLPYSGSLAIEKLDMDLRVCMEESRQVYCCMTRPNRSAVGPLQGKNLAWRKHMIKHDLGPRMERIADNLRKLEQKANETNHRVRREANEAIGPFGSGRDGIVSL